MLHNSLFEIKSLTVSPDKNTAQANVILNSGHAIFEGHFPGSPVLPGVCIVQIIKETVSSIVSKEVMLVKSNTIKFQLPINPLINNELTIDLKTNSEADNIIVSAQVSFQEKNFCSFKGEFVVKT